MHNYLKINHYRKNNGRTETGWDEKCEEREREGEKKVAESITITQ